MALSTFTYGSIIIQSHLTIVLVTGFELTLLHTNDIHARFEQMNRFGGTCRRDEQCFGGVARRVTIVREIRNKYSNVLLVDAGDEFQGTLWFHVYKGMAAAHFMKKILYDAMALGNHEFDNDISGLTSFLANVTDTFPVLSCNIDATQEEEVGKYLRKAVVKSVGPDDIKVGIIGYTTSETPELSKTGKLKFTNEIICIQQEAKRLKSEGVNIIIAVGHAGFKLDKKIASEVEDVDIVVGGHTNTFLYTGTPPSSETPADVYPVVISRGSSQALVVQNYAFGKYMGFIQVTFDMQGNIANFSGNPILLNSSIEEDPETVKEVEAMSEPITKLYNTTIGNTFVFLNGSREACRLRECNMGNLLTDAAINVRIKTDVNSWAHISMAMINSGSIRAAISQGSISVGDIMAVQPFGNTMDMIEIEGRYLYEIFETSVKDYNVQDAHGRFLQISGIHVVFDLCRSAGQRVVSLKGLCTDCLEPRYELIENDKIYRVIVTKFMAEGGDGYSTIPTKMVKYHNFGDVDVTILRSYIAMRTPITIAVEERIQFLTKYPECQNSSAKYLTSKFVNLIVMIAIILL